MGREQGLRNQVKKNTVSTRCSVFRMVRVREKNRELYNYYRIYPKMEHPISRRNDKPCRPSLQSDLDLYCLLSQRESNLEPVDPQISAAPTENLTRTRYMVKLAISFRCLKTKVSTLKKNFHSSQKCFSLVYRLQQTAERVRLSAIK